MIGDAKLMCSLLLFSSYLLSEVELIFVVSICSLLCNLTMFRISVTGSIWLGVE